MCLVCPTPCAVRLGITGAEHTRSCWYLCWYLFQREQAWLVCPTSCAVRLSITGAEHTRPCWYLCWYLFRTVLRLVSPGNVSLARARTRTGTPRVQCFARSARAMYLLARVHVCVVCESLHSVNCACIPCTVLRLVRTGHVPTCPCSHLYWYLLRSWTARALYILAVSVMYTTCPCLYPCTVFCYG